ncbi:MAG: hypothetical protein Q7T11_00185, partial [Deltaproteobacteria bacterium]|nr:hypothetical protein [Deltaproteobacteria bacterium]
MGLNTTRALERIIHQDRILTHEEFKQVEKLVFAGDGIAEEDEITVLKALSVFTPYAFYQFEQEADRYRLGLIGTRGFTLERYLEKLTGSQMRPANEVEVLKKAPQEKQPGLAAVVQSITEVPGKGFTISISVGEKIFSLPYAPGQTVESLTRFPDLSGAEVLVALENYRWVVTEGQRKSADKALSALSASVRADLIGGLLFEGRRSGRSYNEKGMAVFERIDSYKKDHPLPGVVTKGENPFKAALNLPVDKEAVKNGWESLPLPMRNFLVQNGLAIHFVDMDQVQREFYNQHPLANIENFSDFIGLTIAGKPDLILQDSEKDPQTTSYTLVHEIGHALFFKLDRLTGGVWAEAQGETQGMVAEVVSHHYKNLWSAGKIQGVGRQTTAYSSQNYVEWFAEAFAIYHLGKNGRDLKRGETSLFYERRHFAESLEDFKAKDPVGYLLMARLDDAFENGDTNPEDVFSWAAYEEATSFAFDECGGVIDAEAERDWLERILNFSPQTKWKEAIKDFWSLRSLSNEEPDLMDFFPFARDYFSAAFDQFEKGSQLTDETAQASFLEDLREFALRNPLEIDVALFLADFFDPMSYLSLMNPTLVGNAKLQTALEALVVQFQKAHPEEPQFYLALGKMQEKEGKHEEAKRAYSKGMTLVIPENQKMQGLLMDLTFGFANC